MPSLALVFTHDIYVPRSILHFHHFLPSWFRTRTSKNESDCVIIIGLVGPDCSCILHGLFFGGGSKPIFCIYPGPPLIQSWLLDLGLIVILMLVSNLPMAPSPVYVPRILCNSLCSMWSDYHLLVCRIVCIESNPKFVAVTGRSSVYGFNVMPLA